MDLVDRLRQLIVRVVRPPRHLYRYLTGDPTCLGFVRLMCVIVVLFDVVAVVAYIRDGNLGQGGTALGASVAILALTGPHLFRAAASTDRSPIGPGAEAVKPDLMVAVDVGLSLSLIGAFLVITAGIAFGNRPPTGDMLSILSCPALTFAIWAPQDRDGGKGDRTLGKDIRRLLARRFGPEAAGGQVLPAVVDA